MSLWGGRPQRNTFLFWMGGLAPLLGVYSWPGLSLGYQHLAWAKKIKDRGVFDGFRKIDPFWEHLLYLVGLWGCLGVSWGPFGATLASLSSSLGLLGAPWGDFGKSWAPFRALSGSPGSPKPHHRHFRKRAKWPPSQTCPRGCLG